MIQRFIKYCLAHKVISTIIILVVLYGGYRIYSALASSAAPTRYVLASAQRGSLINSISGSGQVSVTDQVDVTPKVSGTITYVAVKQGQHVRAGALLAAIDSTGAQQAVRDAQINLDNADIALEKLKLSQSLSLPNIQDSINTAQNSLNQAYQSGFNEVANTFLDLPNILTGIRAVLYDTTVGAAGQPNSGAYLDLIDRYQNASFQKMINKAVDGYVSASALYKNNLDSYKNSNRGMPPDQITALISETLNTAKSLSQTVKDEQNMLDVLADSLKQYQSNRQVPAAVSTYQNDIAGYISQLNGHINSLNGSYNSITTGLQSLASLNRNLSNAQQSNPLDLGSQEISVEQRKSALADARSNLSYYYIRAPFDGVVAKVNVSRGDSASSGTGVATLITQQGIASLTLNEVDVAKVGIGQNATLTFDAISGLSIAGKVTQIDTLGTVSQGVVSYGVQIAFDTQDERIKPGMSVAAAIVTSIKPDVLMVPTAAVKTLGTEKYVLLPAATASESMQFTASVGSAAGVSLAALPAQQIVTTGAANDSMTEITGGLNAGDVVIVKAVTSSSTAGQNRTQGNSLFSIPGAGANRGGTQVRTQVRLD